MLAIVSILNFKNAKRLYLKCSSTKITVRGDRYVICEFELFHCSDEII
jgi:hypothetical protein